MLWRERGAGGETVVRFAGVLDASSAREVRPFLQIEPPGKIIVDLTQVTYIDYYGLSVLVAEIVQSGRAVLLRGLHANHVRMLRYFGLDPARFGLSDCPYLTVG